MNKSDFVSKKEKRDCLGFDTTKPKDHVSTDNNENNLENDM